MDIRVLDACRLRDESDSEAPFAHQTSLILSDTRTTRSSTSRSCSTARSSRSPPSNSASTHGGSTRLTETITGLDSIGEAKGIGSCRPCDREVDRPGNPRNLAPGKRRGREERSAVRDAGSQRVRGAGRKDVAAEDAAVLATSPYSQFPALILSFPSISASPLGDRRLPRKERHLGRIPPFQGMPSEHAYPRSRD